jgi:predicted enzyme related to lactoylglutathione lyase
VRTFDFIGAEILRPVPRDQRPPAQPPKRLLHGRLLFDVKDLQGFIKKLEAAGIKLDRPYTKNEQTGAALAFITDPWGTYIELNERPNPVYLT